MDGRSKNVVLLFSSGLDSSYLLYKGMEQGHTVFPMYLTLVNNWDKVKVEKEAAYQQILAAEEHFGRPQESVLRFSNLMEGSVGNQVRFEIVGNGHNGLVGTQAPVWIASLLFTIDLTDMDEVWIGYVKGDSWVEGEGLGPIREAYDGFRGFFDHEPADLRFPIADRTKRELWDELPEAMRDHVFFCEDPYESPSYKIGGYPCGECNVCERYRQELPEIYERQVSPTIHNHAGSG